MSKNSSDKWYVWEDGARKGQRLGVREPGQSDKQEKALGTEMRTRRLMWLEHGQQWGGEQKTRPESTLGRV